MERTQRQFTETAETGGSKLRKEDYLDCRGPTQRVRGSHPRLTIEKYQNLREKTPSPPRDRRQSGSRGIKAPLPPIFPARRRPKAVRERTLLTTEGKQSYTRFF